MVISVLTARSFQKHNVWWVNMIWTNMGQLVASPRLVPHPSKFWVVESGLGEKVEIRVLSPSVSVQVWGENTWVKQVSFKSKTEQSSDQINFDKIDKPDHSSGNKWPKHTFEFTLYTVLIVYLLAYFNYWGGGASLKDSLIEELDLSPGSPFPLSILHNLSDSPSWLTKQRIPTYLLPIQLGSVFMIRNPWNKHFWEHTTYQAKC